MRYWIVVVGAGAAAIPVGPGIERMVEGRPGALPLLVLGAVVAIVTVVLNTVAVMYQARQETLRKGIELQPNPIFERDRTGSATVRAEGSRLTLR